MDEVWTPQEKALAMSMTSMTFVGSKESVRKQFLDFQEKYQADEIMAVTYIFDPDKQKRSYQLFKEVADGV
jgi:alkanesulfonate monooxygenase SsuD/methylene tetrahydromethanopterin reductase-like flavin-dependent oxidoreductase (luciferase family)